MINSILSTEQTKEPTRAVTLVSTPGTGLTIGSQELPTAHEENLFYKLIDSSPLLGSGLIQGLTSEHIYSIASSKIDKVFVIPQRAPKHVIVSAEQTPEHIFITAERKWEPTVVNTLRALTHVFVSAQLKPENVFISTKRDPGHIFISAQQEPEHVLLSSDVQPFIMAVQRYIETEQISAARKLLENAPISILSNPIVQRLRTVLAPPTVSQLKKHSSDHRKAYAWLKMEAHNYRGRWVALEGDHLIAVASSLSDLRKQLRTIPFITTPLIHHIS